MAHTDACKIQVTEFVKKLTEKGLSVNKACKEVERESDGIPAETIRRWWKEIEKKVRAELVKNDQPLPTPENIITIPNNQVEHGGKREGAGRQQKYTKTADKFHLQALRKLKAILKEFEQYRDDPKIAAVFSAVDEVTWKILESKMEGGEK